MTPDLQTLIAYGKKLEQNEKTLGEYEIKDGNFMIVMIAKVSFCLVLLISFRQNRLQSKMKISKPRWLLQ